MFESVFQVMQLISLILGISIGMLTISKHFRESGFFRNIKYLLAILIPIIFLKEIISIVARSFYILPIFSLVILLYAIFILILTKSDLAEQESLFKTDGLPESFALTLTPILSVVINKLFGYQGIIKLNAIPQLSEYLQYLNSNKINLTTYAFMGQELLTTTYFIVKCIEIALGLLLAIKGIIFLSRIQNNDFYGNRELFRLNCIQVFTLFVISSDVYVWFLRKVFDMF